MPVVNGRVRAVVGDGDLLAREGVAWILEAVSGVDVVAVVGDARALREAVEQSRPDVVIADTRVLPRRGLGGLEIAEMLDARYPGIGLLALSGHNDPRTALALFRNGVNGRGYLLKHRVADAEEFARAVWAIAHGGTLVDPLVIEAVVAAHARAEHSPLRFLTPRERSTLRQLSRGKNNQAIAQELGVTRRAVEHQLRSIFTKLALHDDPDSIPRVQATLLFLAEQEPHDQPDADAAAAGDGARLHARRSSDSAPTRRFTTVVASRSASRAPIDEIVTTAVA
jgi:DNA-binding NarL/FixJ family response regulator